MPALLPSCVQGEVLVNVGNVFVMRATVQTSTDSFVNVTTPLVTAHFLAWFVVDMASVSVEAVHVMQDGKVLHVTAEMM